MCILFKRGGGHSTCTGLYIGEHMSSMGKINIGGFADMWALNLKSSTDQVYLQLKVIGWIHHHSLLGKIQPKSTNICQPKSQSPKQWGLHYFQILTFIFSNLFLFEFKWEERKSISWFLKYNIHVFRIRDKRVKIR